MKGSIGKAVLFVLLAACLAAGIFFAGKSRGESPDRADEGLLIGICQKNMTEGRQVAFHADVEAEADRHERMKCIFSDANDSARKQEEDIRGMITRRVDLLILTLCEDGDLSGAVGEAVSAGIPVLVVGETSSRAVPCTVHIYVDNYGAGRKAGDAAAVLLQGQGVVLELQGDPETEISQELKRGFRDAISAYPGIVKQYVVAGYWTSESAVRALNRSEIPFQDETIDLIFAHNVEMLMGVRQFSRAKGRTQKLLGVDYLYGSSMDIGKYQLSRLAAFVACPTGGTEAVRCGLRLLAGEEMPGEIEIGTDIIYEEAQ